MAETTVLELSLMKTIFESITAFFAAEKWPVHQIENKHAYSMKFRGGNGEWVCVAESYEEDRTLVFYSVCPLKAGRENYPALAELINRLNYCQVCGNFELGYLEGDVRFRTNIEVPDQDLSPLMIDRVVYNNVATMDMYLPAIDEVIRKGTAPLDAIAKVLT